MAKGFIPWAGFIATAIQVKHVYTKGQRTAVPAVLSSREAAMQAAFGFQVAHSPCLVGAHI